MLKKILPGLVPLFIYIIAEEIWGAEIGLYIALATGIGQLIYFYVKDKRIDKFVLFDTALILALGTVSLVLDNPIFFKLKPALIEFILVALIAFSLFSKHNILLQMSKRYMQEGVEIKDVQAQLLRKQMSMMLVLLAIHIALIIYSAYYMSEAAWGFISGVLFYIIIGVWAGVMFLLAKLKQRNIEWLPIVDEQGKVIGKASRDECHQNPSLLHPVVRLHIFRSDGKLLLQQRSFKSEVEPGKWDAACAGHVQFGESADQGLARELYEEVRIKDIDAKPIYQRVMNFEHQSELILLYYAFSDKKATANKKEVEAIMEATLEEVEAMKDNVTPAILEEMSILKKIRKSHMN